MEIIGTYIFSRNDKFEETPNEKVVNMSKLTKSYFNSTLTLETTLCSTLYAVAEPYLPKYLSSFGLK